MQSKASTVAQYLEELPEERKEAMKTIRQKLVENLPKGFEEGMTYGMIGYFVPHSVWPAGYHCNPKDPLPFINLASQKNFISMYHMGLYAEPGLLEWFTGEYKTRVPAKLDMGKGCVRFKKMNQIPYDLIAELAGKMTPKDWMGYYEKMLDSRKKA